MVLLEEQPPPLPPTLPQWLAEVAAFERDFDGHVHRGHKWLARLERARQQRWISSIDDAVERRRLAALPTDQQRVLASLHRLESRMPPADRAILHRSTLRERLDVLCQERLRAALDADSQSVVLSLEERRRASLLRPGPAALEVAISEAEARAEAEAVAAAAAAAATSDFATSPEKTENLAKARSDLAKATVGEGPISEADERLGALDWEAACDAVAEEWQLMIEVMLRSELRQKEANEAAIAAAADKAGATASRIDRQDAFLASQAAAAQPVQPLGHVLGSLGEREMRASCGAVMQSASRCSCASESQPSTSPQPPPFDRPD